MTAASRTMPQMNRFVIGFLRRVPVISLVAALTTPAFAQPPRRFEAPPVDPVETGTSTIAGRAIDVVSKKTVPGVEIELLSYVNGIARVSRTKTDARGAYAFVGIAEGTYSLGIDVIKSDLTSISDSRRWRSREVASLIHPAHQLPERWCD